MSKTQSGLRAFSANTTPIYPPLVEGKGARVRDVEGREYIDCVSQTLNLNLGQCHDDVVAAVIEQARRLTYASSRFSSDVSLELHEKLVEMTPEPLGKVNMASVIGSAANECALKAARKRTGRRTVVSVFGSHHGQTTEAMRASGKHWDRSYLGERNARFVPPPDCSRCPFKLRPETCSVECLDTLDEIWEQEDGDVCAVLVEPIMVDAGVLVPPRKYHERLRAFCDDFDIALVHDEIQTAFGWLGVMFASEIYDVVPDLLSLGKGLGAGFPLAATVFTEEYDVLTYGEHEMTAGAHVISCAAALAMLRYLDADGRFEEIREKGAVARARLERLAEDHPVLGDVRGVGLLLGLEIVDPAEGSPDEEAALRIVRGLRDEGVILRLGNVGNGSAVLQFKPPLVIGYDELELAFSALDRVLARVDA
jgi:validone 7-phosphate aminotransferase